MTVMDGGAFLWTCNLSKGEYFSIIAEKYVAKCKELNVTVVVFDGYEECTNGEARSRRGKSLCGSVEVNDGIKCVTDRAVFLNNYVNKEKFIGFLSTKLTKSGVRVVQTPGDADTTIIREALHPQGCDKDRVQVMADDTDILCLLLHHYQLLDSPREVFIRNVTKKCISRTSGASGEENHRSSLNTRVDHCIQDILNEAEEVTKELILFAHAFFGCDTVSAIFNLGKVSIQQKLKKSESLRSLAKVFYNNESSQETIGNASIALFEGIYSDNKAKDRINLSKIRHNKYEGMVASSRTSIDPSCLPPTPRAAYFHGLRTYHQMKVWIHLSVRDMEPIKWGWERKDGKLCPIMTDKNPAPESLLNIIRCSRKKQCSARCSCRKAGLKCASTCRECRGISCCNGSPGNDDIDE